MILQNVLHRNAFILLLMAICLTVCLVLSACDAGEPESEQLAKNVQLQLVDWHISGLWVINSPVAWVRVSNYNNVPVHDITFEYKAFAADGRPLDHDTFTIDGTVPPRSTRNFIELYLGLVDLYTERLSIQLLSVHQVK